MLLYQLGKSTAIAEAVRNRSLLWVGAGLVLTAAIARNYDQVFILEKPWWPLGPLAFSTFSALFIYLFVYLRFLRPAKDAETKGAGFWKPFVVFLGLFWMTSPIAWLYAIPVERFLGSYEAAIANVTLLAAVSAWRVWLLSRALSVALGVGWKQTLPTVVLAGALELVLLSMTGCAATLEIMGGLRHSPERVVKDNMTGVAIWVGLAAAVASGFYVNRFGGKHRGCSFSRVPGGSFPFSLVFLLVFWVALAVFPQMELGRNHRLNALLAGSDYAAALKHLSAHEKKDFAPAHRIPPDPYTSAVFRSLPGLFGAMNGTEADWVRTEYLQHLEIMLQHPLGWIGEDEALELLKGLQAIPEGQAWVRAHADGLKRLFHRLGEKEDVKAGLEKLGVE